MEDNSCKKICRFCLETSNSNFETIEEVTLANLDFFWLKLNLAVSEESVMCGNCAVTIAISSDFKTKCLEMEDCIVSSVKDKDSIKIDLREVYVSKMSGENIVNVPEDHIVCRLCLDLLKYDSPIFLRDSIDTIEKLEQYFPELDLTCTYDPVICGSCQNCLQCYFNFIDTCLTTEKKITEYCKVEGTNGMGQIDLNSLIHFISKDFLKCKFEVGTVKIEGTCNEDSENANNDVGMKKEEIPDMELDIKKGSSAQESEETDENRFHSDHPSPSHSDCVSQLTRVNPAKYTSEICGKREHDLQVHMTSYKDDTEATTYKCGLCDLETKRKPNLKQHMLTHKTHSDTALYKCDLCEYKAKRMPDVKRHMLTHKTDSETTMYKCDLCEYQTKWKYILKRHMLIHKTDSEIAMYKCDLCPYKAKEKYVLKIHLLTHKTRSEISTYKCDLCDYEAKLKAHLKGHMLIHKTVSEITVFKCDLCDYQTKWKHVLNRHMLIHSKTNMYKCDLCKYETKRKGDLKRHIQTHKTHSDITIYKSKT